MFEPENNLEALLQAPPGIARSCPGFYRALLEAAVYLLTPDAPIKPGQHRSPERHEKSTSRPRSSRA